MKVFLSKFPIINYNEEEHTRERIQLKTVIEKIEHEDIEYGLIFMNAQMYTDIRMWDRDELDLYTEKNFLKKGIMAKILDGRFEIIVSNNVEDNIFGIIQFNKQNTMKKYLSKYRTYK